MTFYLVSEHEDGFHGEPARTEVKEVLQAGPQQIHD